MPKTSRARRVKEVREPYIAQMTDGSGYILLVDGMPARQFEDVEEAIAARDDIDETTGVSAADPVTCRA